MESTKCLKGELKGEMSSQVDFYASNLYKMMESQIIAEKWVKSSPTPLLHSMYSSAQQQHLRSLLVCAFETYPLH